VISLEEVECCEALSSDRGRAPRREYAVDIRRAHARCTPGLSLGAARAARFALVSARARSALLSGQGFNVTPETRQTRRAGRSWPTGHTNPRLRAPRRAAEAAAAKFWRAVGVPVEAAPQSIGAMKPGRGSRHLAAGARCARRQASRRIMLAGLPRPDCLESRITLLNARCVGARHDRDRSQCTRLESGRLFASRACRARRASEEAARLSLTLEKRAGAAPLHAGDRRAPSFAPGREVRVSFRSGRTTRRVRLVCTLRGR